MLSDIQFTRRKEMSVEIMDTELFLNVDGESFEVLNSLDFRCEDEGE